MAAAPSISAVAVAVAALLAVPAAAAHAQDAPRAGSPGIGDRVQPALGNGGYDVVRTDLGFGFTRDLREYEARTDLQARATHALSRFDLDLVGGSVKEVTVDGVPARWDRTATELRITPALPIASGSAFRVQVRIRKGVPEGGLDETDDVTPGIATRGGFVETAAQPSGARRIAAVADHPAQKAPMSITLTTPDHVNAIANGRLTTVVRWSSQVTRTFTSDEPLAPEVIQIGVGPFRIVDATGPGGLPLRHAVPRDREYVVGPGLAVVPRALAFLERRLGAFPLPLYGVYATPYAGLGEVETQGLTLLDADELSESAIDDGYDSTITHEIAHEWFGNSVSPRRWSDLWLNEGHATYYEWRWDEAEGYRTVDDRMRALYEGRARRLLRVYGPLARPHGAPWGPQLAPFTDMPYLVGALALYALRLEVGADAFDRIERAWVSRFRHGVAGTEDFISLAGEQAGRDLRPFLRPWLYGTRLPPMPERPRWR